MGVSPSQPTRRSGERRKLSKQGLKTSFGAFRASKNTSDSDEFVFFLTFFAAHI